jgi:hypothetical protein
MVATAASYAVFAAASEQRTTALMMYCHCCLCAGLQAGRVLLEGRGQDPSKGAVIGF